MLQLDIFSCVFKVFFFFFYTNCARFLPNTHLVYNYESTARKFIPKETFIISSALNTQVVRPHISFHFPAAAQGCQLWIKGNKSISFLNIHQLELHESWRQTVGVPAREGGGYPSQCRERTPLRPKHTLETSWLYPTPSTEEGENCQVGHSET